MHIVLSRSYVLDLLLQRSVQWRPEHKGQIKKKFHIRASHRLSEMFRDARIAGEHLLDWGLYLESIARTLKFSFLSQ